LGKKISEIPQTFSFITTFNQESLLLATIHPTVHNGHRSNHNKLLTIVVCATNCEKFVRHQRRVNKKKKGKNKNKKIKEQHRGRAKKMGNNKNQLQLFAKALAAPCWLRPLPCPTTPAHRRPPPVPSRELKT